MATRGARRRHLSKHWLSVWADGLHIAVEAPQVIALRVAKILRGGAPAHTESHLMVNEKLAAALAASTMSPSAAARMYRQKVAANHRRLRKG